LFLKEFDNEINICRRRKELLSIISGWKPSVSSVKQARILLVGPVGAGKSSLFNSINSVFKGYVSSQANTGTAGTSLTTQVMHLDYYTSDILQRDILLLVISILYLNEWLNICAL